MLRMKPGQMHILGLFIDYKNKNLINKLKFLQEKRANRNIQFINEFNKLGFNISLEELKQISGKDSISKPHFALLFLKKGYIKEKSEIFDKYFNKPPFTEIENFSYTAKEVISLIKEIGGLAILAHPQSLELDINSLEQKIIELKEYGLDGLECYHSKQSFEEMKQFKQLAQKLNLLISKGSDYHRTNC